MTKNMTRKGLAVSAAGALALAGLTAAPAHALSLGTNPADGTSYVGLAGDQFDLTVSYSADFANFANAKIYVTNPDGIAATVTEAVGGGTVALAAADADGVFALTSTGVNETIEITNTDGPGRITVQAFIDSDGNGEPSAGEVAGPQRTVTFLDPADVTFTVSLLNAAAINDTTVDLQINLSGNVNVTQIDLSSFNATVENNAGVDRLDDVAGGGANGTQDEVAGLGGFVVNDDEDALELEDLALALALAGGDKLAIQASYDDQNAVADETSNLLAVTVAATDAAAINGETEETGNLRNDAANTWSIRDDYTGNTVFAFEVNDAANGLGDPVAGSSVTVKIAEHAVNSLDEDTVITAGGESLSNEDAAVIEDIEFTAVSDADGMVYVTVRSNSGTAADKITIDVTSNEDSNVVATQEVVTYTAEVEANYTAALVQYPELVVAAADETNVTATFVVLDDYGVPATDETRRVAVTGGADDEYKTLSNGRATITATLDNANLVYVAETQSANGNWNAIAATQTTLVWVDTDTQFEVDAVSVTLGVAAIAITGETLAAADTRVGDTAPEYAAGDGTSVTIQVDDAAGNAVVGSVTVSAPGLALSWGDEVYALDSLTAITDNTGELVLEVYGNVTGDYVITATSGGVTSDDADLEIQAPAANSEASVNLSVTGNEPGKTMTLSGTVTDKWGNLVDVVAADFDLDWDGPGYVVGTLPAATTDGAFSFKVLLGSNDVIEGSLTVTTAGADGKFSTDNGGVAADDDDNVTATLSLAPAVSSVATWTKNLNDGTVKMYAKNIVGAGKVQFMVNGAEVAWVRAADATDPKLRSANGSYYLVRTVELVEGQKNVLEIYVDGERTTRSAYTY